MPPDTPSASAGSYSPRKRRQSLRGDRCQIQRIKRPADSWRHPQCKSLCSSLRFLRVNLSLRALAVHYPLCIAHRLRGVSFSILSGPGRMRADGADNVLRIGPMGECVPCICPSNGQSGVIRRISLVLPGLLQFLHEVINGLSPPKLPHNPAPASRLLARRSRARRQSLRNSRSTAAGSTLPAPGWPTSFSRIEPPAPSLHKLVETALLQQLVQTLIERMARTLRQRRLQNPYLFMLLLILPFSHRHVSTIEQVYEIAILIIGLPYLCCPPDPYRKIVGGLTFTSGC